MSKPQLIPFYQYWRRVKCDHFYTTDLTEIDEYVPGETGENFAKASGVCCLILSAPDPRYGCVPLHRYYTSDRIIKGLDKDEKKDDCKANHLYTIKPESDGLSVPNDGKDEDGNGLLVTQLKALAKKEKLNLIVTQHDSGDFTKYIYEGIAGYVYKDNPPTGAVPLNRFKCKTDTYLDYFYTTSGDQDKVLKQEDSCFFTDAVVNEYLSTPFVAEGIIEHTRAFDVIRIWMENFKLWCMLDILEMAASSVTEIVTKYGSTELQRLKG